MIRKPCSLGLIRPCLPALLILCILPADAPAQALHFRNECPAPVVIQASFISRGVFRRDRPYLLKLGDATPPIKLPGDKIITVYDAKVPNRILFQGAAPVAPTDLYFGITVNARMPGRVLMQPRPPPRRQGGRNP
jgi:hypothetical protein